MRLTQDGYDWTVPPGAYLEEVMEHHGLTVEQIALRANRTIAEIEKFLVGELAVTPELAADLERASGIRAEAFVLYDLHYEKDLARLGHIRGRRPEPSLATA